MRNKSAKKMPGEREEIFLLSPSVQHYDWGGKTFIPALLRRDNPDDRPFAELWMGAHPSSPSMVYDGQNKVGLDSFLAHRPEHILGHETYRDYGGLPFLLKILDVAQPLSIQVHPGHAQARRGFENEELLNIPLQSVQRHYKDPFHKPELVVALGEKFWLLAGFRSPAEIGRLLKENPELIASGETIEPTPEGTKNLFSHLMLCPPETMKKMVSSLYVKWKRDFRRRPMSPRDHRYWFMKVADRLGYPVTCDRGLLAILVMNIIELSSGEGLFLPSGVLHAFLRGTALEVSANSDNVLRGGLTHKHVNVAELLKSLEWGGQAVPTGCAPTNRDQESVFASPAGEFELAQLAISPGARIEVAPSWSGQIFLVAPGKSFSGRSVNSLVSVTARSKAGRLNLRAGESFFVPRGVGLTLSSIGGARVFRAGVPPVPTFRGRHPTSLTFGTSGLRGRVEDITDLEAYINTRGFLRFVRDQGKPLSNVWIGMDLRPSSPRIARSVARAVVAEGARARFAGVLPSPALMCYATAVGCPSVMVTGSHIPFDRNGIKFNLPSGEVLKEDENAILNHVRRARAEEYNRPVSQSSFDEGGYLLSSQGAVSHRGEIEPREHYLRRYLNFFSAGGLKGWRVVVYQHSAAGRDVLTRILKKLGARVTVVGRSDTFVPIDTEDISEERLADLQRWMGTALAGGPVDALVSTDGDSDRPLICGRDAQGKLIFFPGDRVGPLVAEYLGADGVVTPISANDVVEKFLENRVLPRTRIGSPYVIRSMQDNVGKFKRLVGYEANGGFLTAQPIERRGRRLAALPTRDAMLPILCTLFSAKEQGLTLAQLFQRLPPRFTASGLWDNFPTGKASEMVDVYFPLEDGLTDFHFGDSQASYRTGGKMGRGKTGADRFGKFQLRLQDIFSEKEGFVGGLVRMNRLDGLRLWFGNGDVVHLRASGNAPQLRVYAVANRAERAKEIIRLALDESEGFIRRMLGKK